jgi:hypothetical protein
MNRATPDLAEKRRIRDQAKAGFKGKLSRTKQDLAPDAVKARLINDARHKAVEIAQDAMAIANDSRGVIVGTVAVLAVWAARRQIGSAVKGLWAAGANSAGRRWPKLRLPFAGEAKED